LKLLYRCAAGAVRMSTIRALPIIGSSPSASSTYRFGRAASLRCFATKAVRVTMAPALAILSRLHNLVSASRNMTLRSTWPIRLRPLSNDVEDDLSASTTAEERLAMMWPLSRDAWLLSGQAVPTYERHQAPVRLSKLGR